MRNLTGGLCVLLLLASCAASKPFNPSKKFAPEELQDDYGVFRASLQEAHPSLYWYTPKDSMDYYFDVGRGKLNDSLTESGFRYVLAYVLAKIRCGHTSVRASDAALRYNGPPGLSFPLFVKAWPDTVVVTVNLNRKDSTLTRGAIIKSIDGRPINAVVDSLFSFLSADGYNTTHKYQTLSNGGTFRTLYAVAFGLKQHTAVEFIDTAGRFRTALLDLYNPRADTPRRATRPPQVLSKKERKRLELEGTRNLRVDTALHTAFMGTEHLYQRQRLARLFSQIVQRNKEAADSQSRR